MSGHTDWRKLDEEIIAALDVAAEYAALGVRFPDGSNGREPNANGWINCHAIGREDKNPSAAVNVRTGVYVDLGNGREATNLYHFAVKRGAFADWKEAQREYAKKAGMSRRLPKKDRDRPEDKFEYTSGANWLSVRGLCRAFPPITIESLQLAGAKIARYPAKSSSPQYVVALPAYGPTLLNEPPRGFVLQSVTGGEIQVYQGEGNAQAGRKRMNVGPSGLVGRKAIERIAEHSEATDEQKTARPIDRVWKVEGISDLLALQSVIPPELRDSHLVLTNAAGASEATLPNEVASVFDGLRVFIVHDCDDPGQDGAKLWRGAIGKHSAGCFNVVLPYPITPTKGKDLRDWINDGKAYSDLLTLADEAEKQHQAIPHVEAGNSPSVPSSAKQGGADTDFTQHQLILKRLGAIVLGYYEGTETIVAFAVNSGKVFEIRNIQHYGLETLLLHLGPEVESMVATGSEVGPGQYPMPLIRRAFAVEGGKKRITDQNSLGVGVWETNGRLLLVGAGEAAIWNCQLIRTSVPSLDGRICDFGSPEPWYEFDWVEKHLKESESPDWCKTVLQESCDLFRRWDNWVHEDTPELITALICSTWLQSVWEWRPQVAVAGPTASGKSMFLEETLRYLFGPLAMFCAQATEAGLRHQIRNTSKVIIIDEFEHDEHRAKILKLFRTSSRGANIVRGTSDQKGAIFHLKHIPWVGAIETGMNRAADRNRYVMIELRKVPAGRGAKLRVPPPDELKILGLKLLVVAMRHWKRAFDLSAKLRSDAFEGVDHRVVESYSVPVAMLAAILGMDHPESKALLGGILKRRDFSSQQESDEEQLLKAIYESVVYLAKGEKATVSELIAGTIMDHSESPSKILQRVGIKKVRRKVSKTQEVDCLFFVKASICRELLKGSPLAGMDLDQILLRVQGATRGRYRIFGHFPYGICIPIDSVNALLSGENDPDCNYGENGEVEVDSDDIFE